MADPMTITTIRDAIEACPFCGWQECELRGSEEHGDAYHVVCMNNRCEAEGPVSLTSDYAVENWNTRIRQIAIEAAPVVPHERGTRTVVSHGSADGDAQAPVGEDEADPDLGKIGPGHVCKHGIRWPHPCDACDAAPHPPAPVEVEVERLREALEKIARWHGEFPETGRFWDANDEDGGARQMSYAACFGSNGERDFMRQIALAALNPGGAER